MEIENIIKSKNSEFYKKHPYNPKTWISISNIKTYLKPEFDKEGVAKRTSEKYFNDNTSQYYQKTPEQIIEMWDEKSNRSKRKGELVDGFMELKYNHTNEGKVLEYRNNCINEDEEMSRKLIGAENCLNDFNRGGLRFECREQKLMMPFNYKGCTYIINGRFDAMFSKFDNMLLLVDWKSSEDIKTQNNFGQKMFGPCEKLDSCDMNEFTIQVYMYYYMLKKIYGIEYPIYCCIVQFPSKKDYYYRIHKPSFDYDERMMERIIKYAIGKKIEENEKSKETQNK